MFCISLNQHIESIFFFLEKICFPSPCGYLTWPWLKWCGTLGANVDNDRHIQTLFRPSDSKQERFQIVYVLLYTIIQAVTFFSRHLRLYFYFLVSIPSMSALRRFNSNRKWRRARSLGTSFSDGITHSKRQPIRYGCWVWRCNISHAPGFSWKPSKWKSTTSSRSRRAVRRQIAFAHNIFALGPTRFALLIVWLFVAQHLPIAKNNLIS